MLLKGSHMMTNQEVWKLYEGYVEGWKAVTGAQRSKMLAEVLTEDFQYLTPQHESGGINTVLDDMAAFQEKFLGGYFGVVDFSIHHDVALFTWSLVQADQTILALGHDQIRISSDGRIASLVTFAPSTNKP
jgi:hypothetical protein